MRGKQHHNRRPKLPNANSKTKVDNADTIDKETIIFLSIVLLLGLGLGTLVGHAIHHLAGF